MGRRRLFGTDRMHFCTSQVARRYGKVELEMMCDAVGGGHFGETVACATGENRLFVVVLRGFLEAEMG